MLYCADDFWSFEGYFVVFFDTEALNNDNHVGGELREQHNGEHEGQQLIGNGE